MTNSNKIELSGKLTIDVGDKEIHIHKVEDQRKPTSLKERASVYTKLGLAFAGASSVVVGLSSKFGEAANTASLSERYQVLMQGLTDSLYYMPTVALDTTAFLIPFAMVYHHMRNKDANMAVSGVTGTLSGAVPLLMTEAFITDPIRDVLLNAMG